MLPKKAFSRFFNTFLYKYGSSRRKMSQQKKVAAKAEEEIFFESESIDWHHRDVCSFGPGCELVFLGMMGMNVCSAV
jgi:hypothetical protein